ncbi:MAG TPA: hypothetical protein VEZ40_18825, partial [Pyrinomonadaceae bacterium]|nr:hypothetical protein [Pyrinomonadaceae bacterium]
RREPQTFKLDAATPGANRTRTVPPTSELRRRTDDPVETLRGNISGQLQAPFEAGSLDRRMVEEYARARQQQEDDERAIEDDQRAAGITAQEIYERDPTPENARRLEREQNMLQPQKDAPLVRDLTERLKKAGAGHEGARTGWDKIAEIKSNPASFLPFLNSAGDLFDIQTVARAAERAEQNRPIEGDEELLRTFDAYSQQDTNWWNKVGSIVAELPSFVTEIAATGGVYKAGQEAVERGALKALGRFAAQRAAGVTAKLARPVAGIPARMILKGARNTIASAPQTALAGATRIPAGAAERMLETGEGLETAFPKAALDHYIEIASEHSGGALGELGGALARTKVGGAVASRIGSLKDGLLARYLKIHPNATATDVRETIERFGWNGIAGEVLEERFGEAARAGTGLEAIPYQSLGEFLHQLSVEAAGFALPGAVAGGASLVGRRKNSREQLLDLKAGAQRVVVVPPEEVQSGEKIVVPNGMRSFGTPEGGRIIYDPQQVEREELIARMDAGTLDELFTESGLSDWVRETVAANGGVLSATYTDEGLRRILGVTEPDAVENLVAAGIVEQTPEGYIFSPAVNGGEKRINQGEGVTPAQVQQGALNNLSTFDSLTPNERVMVNGVQGYVLGRQADGSLQVQVEGERMLGVGGEDAPRIVTRAEAADIENGVQLQRISAFVPEAEVISKSTVTNRKAQDDLTVADDESDEQIIERAKQIGAPLDSRGNPLLETDVDGDGVRIYKPQNWPAIDIDWFGQT